MSTAGCSGPPGNSTSRAGSDPSALRSMWEKYVSKSDDPPSRLDHLMVADWGLSGIFTGENVATGSVLALSGIEVDDPGATYRQVQKVAFFGNSETTLCVR